MPEDPGTVHLIGGGRDDDSVVALLTGFVKDAGAARADTGHAPRIDALLVPEEDDDESAERSRWRAASRRRGR
ncbi:MAG: hypothetical protein ACXWZG_06485, partial [Microbacterium sp.]